MVRTERVGSNRLSRSAAAPALVAFVVGCGSDGDESVPSATAEITEPSITLVVTTDSTSAPAASTVPEPAAETTLPDFDALPVSCEVFGAPDDSEVAFFAADFQSALVAARTTGSFGFVADCLDAVPAAYTGEVPACWEKCSDVARSFVADFSVPPAEPAPAGDFWTSGVVVEYETPEGMVEVAERWEIRVVDDRYEVAGFSVEAP